MPNKLRKQKTKTNNICTTNGIRYNMEIINMYRLASRALSSVPITRDIMWLAMGVPVRPRSPEHAPKLPVDATSPFLPQSRQLHNGAWFDIRVKYKINRRN